MSAIYDEEKTQIDEYRYKVNQGGELNIRVSNGSDRHITIVFIDGKLESVEHDLGDFSLRSNWHVFASIAEKITEIENSYK